MVPPTLTVVIPTLGRRPQRLAAALDALAAQELGEGQRLEVLVAHDPGMQIPPAPQGLPVEFIQSPQPAGAGAKRNLGWQRARASLVAFTDDDCRPAPGWAAALAALHKRMPSAFIQGRTEPDPAELHKWWGFAHTQRIQGESPWHETCNIAYPRTLLERLGGFDDAYGPLGGEDTDLGERARQSGAHKVYEPAALVWHAVEQRNFRQALREARRTRDQPAVLARFPHLRRELVLHLFYRDEHGRLLLALAGALSRRRWLALLAATPYVALHLKHYRLSPLSLIRAATHLPVRAVADAIETAVVARRGLRRGVIAL